MSAPRFDDGIPERDAEEGAREVEEDRAFVLTGPALPMPRLSRDPWQHKREVGGGGMLVCEGEAFTVATVAELFNLPVEHVIGLMERGGVIDGLTFRWIEPRGRAQRTETMGTELMKEPTSDAPPDAPPSKYRWMVKHVETGNVMTCEEAGELVGTKALSVYNHCAKKKQGARPASTKCAGQTFEFTDIQTRVKRRGRPPKNRDAEGNKGSGLVYRTREAVPLKHSLDVGNRPASPAGSTVTRVPSIGLDAQTLADLMKSLYSTPHEIGNMSASDVLDAIRWAERARRDADTLAAIARGAGCRVVQGIVEVAGFDTTAGMTLEHASPKREVRTRRKKTFRAPASGAFVGEVDSDEEPGDQA